MEEREGVIKFSLKHRALSEPVSSPELRESSVSGNSSVLEELRQWRDLARRLYLLGQDPKRYQGLGYGNISARDSETTFLISASQTSGVVVSDDTTFARVLAADLKHNEIVSEGVHPPSSESMTHAALYQCSEQVQWVVHSHCPDIWNASDQLGLPFTEETIPYGTPDMAYAVQALFHQMASPEQGIFVMKGHQDGVVSYGQTAQLAMDVMLTTLAKAKLYFSPS